MITKVTRLRLPGVFQAFDWPDELDGFLKYNLIYGWNGTGKTTLSNVFRAIEQRQSLPHGREAVLATDNGVLRHDQFPTCDHSVRVFNRDFIAASVFPVQGTGELPPIFVLGEDSVEKQRQIESLKTQLEQAETQRSSASASFSRADEEYERFCTTTAQNIKDTLRAPSTTHRYNNYNKAMYKADMQSLIDEDGAADAVLSDEEADAARTECRATPKSAINDLASPNIDPEALHTNIRKALAQTVVRNAIQSLSDSSDAEQWIAIGRRIHRDSGSTTCLYCASAIPQERLAALEAHFNDEYERVVSTLDRLLQNARSELANIQAMDLPDSARVFEHMTAEYETACGEFSNARGVLEAWYTDAIASIEGKKAQLNTFLECPLSDPASLADSIAAVNAILSRHNDYGETQSESVSAAREKLARNALALSLSEYQRLTDAVTDGRQRRDDARAEYTRLSDQIRSLEAEIIGHQRPAEELNTALRRYLGHGELTLESTDTGYRIARNGESALSLSEGERTALALLYFLKSLRTQDFELSQSLVVLDDPISSLDQSAMFAAFAAIREQVKQAQQIVILTHNFMFFRLVREWFKNLRGQDRQQRQFFMLKSSSADGGRVSNLVQLDPLLLNFESEYHYIFSQVYALATGPVQNRLEAYFNAPNMTRRLLEMFLAFCVPDVGDKSLWERMLSAAGTEGGNIDEATLSRLYRYVQSHSHSDAIGDADEDMTMLAESRSVLNDMLRFMRCVNDDHCSRMIRRCAPQETPA